LDGPIIYHGKKAMQVPEIVQCNREECINE
jgi:hypothetical protein